MIKTDCGCKVELLDNSRDAYIHPCPLHAAAPRMLEALQAWESNTNHAVTRLSPSARATKDDARAILRDVAGG